MRFFKEFNQEENEKKEKQRRERQWYDLRQENRRAKEKKTSPEINSTPREEEHPETVSRAHRKKIPPVLLRQ